MKLKIFYNRSVQENAAYYYQLAKETKKKIEGLIQAIAETKAEMQKAETEEKPEVRIKKAKQWFEKFHFSYSSGGKLMIGGRNAQQNDQLVSKHMDDNDLFFHADIQGGSVVILKDGINAEEHELEEAAQFAASFSKSWQNANAAVDVYSVRKEQLTKNVSGGFVPSGAFAILGERKWFKGTRLALRIGINETGLLILPNKSKTELKSQLTLLPSKKGKEKGSLAKSLSKRFKVHVNDLLEILPNGKTITESI